MTCEPGDTGQYQLPTDNHNPIGKFAIAQKLSAEYLQKMYYKNTFVFKCVYLCGVSLKLYSESPPAALIYIPPSPPLFYVPTIKGNNFLLKKSNGPVGEHTYRLSNNGILYFPSARQKATKRVP